MLQFIQDRDSLQLATGILRASGRRIGFVPTMGALHAGHLSLVHAAKAQCDAVAVSIFVNPMQFGPNEDLDRYPKMLEKDRALLEKEGVDVLYVPTVDIMYPHGFSTTVSVSGVSEELDGAARPGHFAGVATVVTKLFMQVMPDMAFFGEKDYQQLKVIERMVADLDIPVVVRGIPTVREAGGLALSSRNQYLGVKERQTAPFLHDILTQCAKKIVSGQNVGTTLDWGQLQLGTQGFGKIDYIELRHAQTLEPLSSFASPARLLAAVWLGGTRLIDNIAVEG